MKIEIIGIDPISFEDTDFFDAEDLEGLTREDFKSVLLDYLYDDPDRLLDRLIFKEI